MLKTIYRSTTLVRQTKTKSLTPPLVFNQNPKNSGSGCCVFAEGTTAAGRTSSTSRRSLTTFPAASAVTASQTNTTNTRAATLKRSKSQTQFT